MFKNSDIKFLLPTVKEAGPDNFIPTSSTTVQIALGDAIAITCMRHKKFGKLDFKKFHPSGSLSAIENGWRFNVNWKENPLCIK